MVFTTTQKVTKHLGYFCNKICYHEIIKITQFGHTDRYNEIYIYASLYRTRSDGLHKMQWDIEFYNLLRFSHAKFNRLPYCVLCSQLCMSEQAFSRKKLTGTGLEMAAAASLFEVILKDMQHWPTAQAVLGACLGAAARDVHGTAFFLRKL